MVDWREHCNLYGGDLSLPVQENALGPVPPLNRPIRLADWEKFWAELKPAYPKLTPRELAPPPRPVK